MSKKQDIEIYDGFLADENVINDRLNMLVECVRNIYKNSVCVYV